MRYPTSSAVRVYVTREVRQRLPAAPLVEVTSGLVGEVRYDSPSKRLQEPVYGHGVARVAGGC
jgi:hypothetical protein